ncbi:MAG: 4Fe-4S binding protein [Desulfuromonadaceae bacterium]|nr:4Fe-4S binding protein [Desulfuromonadaceae bacterium]
MSARYMQPLRILIQCTFFGGMLWLGFRFYHFVQDVISGSIGASAVRPAGIDGFLPISGLLGISSWMKGGGINSVHPAAVVIFVTIVLVSVLLRRSFCSWICPIATISESAWKGGARFFRRSWRFPLWLDCILRSLKYLLMVFFSYSIVLAMSPDSLASFIQSDYHKIADVRLLNFFLHISPGALSIVLVLVALSVILRNPFCRYLCPYGALLGLVAMMSPLRVTRSLDRCVTCGVCSQACPTHIDVKNKKSVNSPECIGCWRCISHCRFNEALSMRAVRRINVPGYVFAILVVLLFWGGTRIGVLSGYWDSSVTIDEYVRLLRK